MSTMIEILKPPADHRAYRVVILPNGIKALLISEAFPLSSTESSVDTRNKGVKQTEPDDITGEASAALCVGIGSFSDLPEVPGIAHFLEHMVFMGSKKFPKENFWDEFIAMNRGESNAWTDCERTCFFFVVQQTVFFKALQIFCQFFVAPLFDHNSVDKEIMAVDNEFQMVSSNDSERVRSIISHELIDQGHPMKKFMAGNRKSLKDDPAQRDINVYEKLKSFYSDMYSADYMTLVIHSMDTLDVIEDQVLKMFSKIPNNNIPRPIFIKAPFQGRAINKILRVVPMEDVHKMDLVWALPPLMDHYRTRVIEFLALLLGHEGKGSILSVLKRRHLAIEITGGNDMTGFTHNSTWTAAILSIKLTEAGLQRYEDVLEIIFQYISLLKTQIPSHVFEEQRHIEETRYIFREQESIYSYVEEVVENMHMFSPEHYLCGRTLYFEYNEQLIKECLEHLRPEEALIILFDKSFSKLTNLKEEPWLGVRYSVADVDKRLISRLNKLTRHPELSLPAPNPYIATDFKQAKVTNKPTKYPIVVHNEPGCRMWYKLDNIFQSPNVYIYFNLISAAIAKSETNVALADILLTCLLQKLSENLYSATLAGYEYAVEGTPTGIVFHVHGYNEKIKVVIEDTLKSLRELCIEEDSFNYVVTHLKQVYMNELIKPVELARAVRYCLVETLDPSIITRCEHISSITYAMILAFQKEFYQSLFIESFVTGNVKPQFAVDIAKSAQKLIKKALPEEDIPKPTVMELPIGDSKCFMPAINIEDTNSCVVLYFQQGSGTIKNVCLNELLTAAMAEPLFSLLRTEKQLGYSVYCQASNSHGVLGFSLVVEGQANRVSMKDVETHMNTFLKDFVQSLEDMPSKKIKEMIEDHTVQKSYEDADLLDQSAYFWQEILKQSYTFDRRKLERAACEKITKDDIVTWCKNLTESNKRQLSLIVEGCTKAKCEFATGEISLDTISGLIKGIKSCVPCQNCGNKRMATFSGEGNTSKATTNFEVENISNLCEFKKKMNALEYHVITN